MEVYDINGVAKSNTGTVSALIAKGDLITYDTAAARLAVGSNNQMLMSDSTQAKGLVWTPHPRSMNYWRQVGTSPLECWYWAGMSGSAPNHTTGAPAINTLIAVPFFAGRGGRLDRIAFVVTTVGGALSKARVGIYNSTSDTNLYPNSMLVDGGEFDTSAVGGTGIKSTTISQTLTTDSLYWFVYLCGTAAPTINGLTIAGCTPTLGMGSTLAGNPAQYLTVALAYAALPATFTAGAALGAGVPVPAIYCRYDQ